jgi:hypothetical protein
MDRQGKYLVDRLALATSPGMFAERVLNALDQKIPRRLHALVVDNPKLGAAALREFPLLPDWGEEADFITATFRSHERLSGAAATLSAVLSALPKADVFYFGGHGASGNEHGGVLLAPEAGTDSALLDATQLEPVVKHCRLAILSACSTAKGERTGGFNPNSLIQALWRAGVPNVLATRWEVESRVTAEVVPLLLQGILSGESPACALQAAIRQIRRPGIRTSIRLGGFISSAYLRHSERKELNMAKIKGSYTPKLNVVFHGLWAYEIRNDGIYAHTSKQQDHVVRAGKWVPEFELKENLLRAEGDQRFKPIRFDDTTNAIFKGKELSDPAGIYCTVMLPPPLENFSLRPISFATTPYLGRSAGLINSKKIAIVQVFTYEVDGAVRLTESDGNATQRNLSFDLPQPITNLYFYAQPRGRSTGSL